MPNRCAHVIELREVFNGEWRLKRFVAEALISAMASDSPTPAELVVRPQLKHLRMHPDVAREEAWADFAEAGEDPFGNC
jgi:hypothetical protein